MLSVTKLSDNAVLFNENGKLYYSNTGYFSSVENKQVCIYPKLNRGRTFTCSVSDLQINGSAYTADKVLDALSFLENFNNGGGGSGYNTPVEITVPAGSTANIPMESNRMVIDFLANKNGILYAGMISVVANDLGSTVILFISIDNKAGDTGLLIAVSLVNGSIELSESVGDADIDLIYIVVLKM